MLHVSQESICYVGFLRSDISILIYKETVRRLSDLLLSFMSSLLSLNVTCTWGNSTQLLLRISHRTTHLLAARYLVRSISTDGLNGCSLWGIRGYSFFYLFISITSTSKCTGAGNSLRWDHRNCVPGSVTFWGQKSGKFRLFGVFFGGEGA